MWIRPRKLIEKSQHSLNYNSHSDNYKVLGILHFSFGNQDRNFRENCL